MLFQVREKAVIAIASGFWIPRHVSIQLPINSSSKEIYVCFSKFFNNFMKKSSIEFPLGGIFYCSRLHICLNIGCSWYMCCCNPLLVFSVKSHILQIILLQVWSFMSPYCWNNWQLWHCHTITLTCKKSLFLQYV